MDLDEHPLERLLPFFCLECGDEFALSPSGHQFCANRLCRDGFDVMVVSQFAPRHFG